MDNAVEAVAEVVREVCAFEVESDRLTFDPATVTATAIKEDADYHGVRVTFLVKLQSARVSMQINNGFGDVVTPTAVMIEYPTLLDFEAPRLRGYPKETVVAEKFEAMTKLGLFNTRVKDLYDLWLLSHQFDFDGGTLVEAVSRTFAHRKTMVVERPVALTPTFGSDALNQTQWAGFLKKSKLADVPETLQSVIEELVAFLSPVAEVVMREVEFNQN